MPRDGPATLSDLTDPVLRIACTKCNLGRQYDVARQIEKHGPDLKLTEILWRVSRDCPWKASMHDPCQAKFLGL